MSDHAKAKKKQSKHGPAPGGKGPKPGMAGRGRSRADSAPQRSSVLSAPITELEFQAGPSGAVTKTVEVVSGGSGLVTAIALAPLNASKAAGRFEVRSPKGWLQAEKGDKIRIEVAFIPGAGGSGAGRASLQVVPTFGDPLVIALSGARAKSGISEPKAKPRRVPANEKAVLRPLVKRLEFSPGATLKANASVDVRVEGGPGLLAISTTDPRFRITRPNGSVRVKPGTTVGVDVEYVAGTAGGTPAQARLELQPSFGPPTSIALVGHNLARVPKSPPKENRSPFDRPTRKRRPAPPPREGGGSRLAPLIDVRADIDGKVDVLRDGLSTDTVPDQRAIDAIALQATRRIARLPEIISPSEGPVSVFALEVGRLTTTVDRLYGWLIYETGKSEVGERLVAATNRLRRAARLHDAKFARRVLSKTETDQVDSTCDVISSSFIWIADAQLRGVKQLLDESKHVDPPPMAVQVMQGLAQIALLTGIGAVGAAVSATTKSAYAVFKPDLGSIDAGFVADILKDGTKAVLNTMRKAVTTRYAATRDPRDAFFGAQMDALAELARKQQAMFLHSGKAEILRARDPLAAAKMFRDGTEKVDLSAVKLEQKRTSLDQWCLALARADLGTSDPKDPDAVTNMADKPGHADPLATPAQLLKGRGVVDILFFAHEPAFRPQVVRAFVGGLNSKLRALLEDRRIGELPLPLVIRGVVGEPDANHPAAGEVWFTRDESGTISLDVAGAGGSGQGARIDAGLEWLNRRAGHHTVTTQGALDGAASVFEALAGRTLAGKFKQ